MKEVIVTDKAPMAIGPYSQAVRVGQMVFTSGQIPVDPVTGGIVRGGISDQAEQVLKNLREVLSAAGATLSDVVKTTVFLKDMEGFASMNEVYARYFEDGGMHARSTVEVARLPKDVCIEMEAVAILP